MQLTFSRQRAIAGAAGLYAWVALAACSDGGAHAAAGAPASAAASANPNSYYLVTQVRPENLQKVFSSARWAYGVCVAAAKLKKMPVQPFPTLPADFVVTRNIYASDGKHKFIKQIDFKIDDSGIDKGCDLKVISSATSEIAQDGKSRITEQNEKGVLTTGPEMPANTEPVSQSKLDRYTEAKVVKGVQLKCKGADCIVDPALALIARGRRPVLAASRLDDATLYGTALLTEPVSLVLGKPIDVSEFKQETGK